MRKISSTGTHPWPGSPWSPKNATEVDRAVVVGRGVHFPHGELANSPGAPICDTTGGKFGPFAGQLFIGDVAIGGWDNGVYKWDNLDRVGLKEHEKLLKEASTLR